MQRIIIGIIILTIASLIFACGPKSGGNNNSTAISGAGEDSPTGAYKRLYAAVKAKDTEGIKSVMSKKSLDFAKVLSAQQNKPLEQVLENGYTATTFAPSLPQIRDERIQGDSAALEVHNDKENNWEDLPFVREDGQWKLAIGEMFANTWKSPGKGQALREREAANAMSNNVVQGNAAANANGNFRGVHPPLASPAANGK